MFDNAGAFHYISDRYRFLDINNNFNSEAARAGYAIQEGLTWIHYSMSLI